MQNTVTKNTTMSKWSPVASIGLSALLTIAAITISDWSYTATYIGLSINWFFSGRILTNYTVYLLLTEKNERTTGNR